MSAGLRIVPASPTYADAIAQLESDAFARLAMPPVRELADPRYLHWVALGSSDVAIGYLQAMVLPDALDVLSVATRSTERRKGIGGALVAAAVTRARALGLSTVTLEVAARNVPARALYGSLGFVDQGIRRDYYPARGAVATDDAVLMALGIAP